MERASKSGLTRAIGVSNFDARELETVCKAARTPPAVNQIQLSPFHYRRALVEACGRLGVAVEAYSPLTHGEDLDHPALREVASRYERTSAQVLLRWGIQRGYRGDPEVHHARSGSSRTPASSTSPWTIARWQSSMRWIGRAGPDAPVRTSGGR